MLQLKRRMRLRSRIIDNIKNSKHWKVYVGTAIVLFLMLFIAVVNIALRR